MKLTDILREIEGEEDLNGKNRKPDPGMIFYLQNAFNATQTLFVGDLDTDRQCAENAGVSFMWASDWVKPFVEGE